MLGFNYRAGIATQLIPTVVLANTVIQNSSVSLHLAHRILTLYFSSLTACGGGSLLVPIWVFFLYNYELVKPLLALARKDLLEMSWLGGLSSIFQVLSLTLSGSKF